MGNRMLRVDHRCPPDKNLLITVAAVKSNSVIVSGQLGGIPLDMMLDSRSAVSLVRKDVILVSTKSDGLKPRNL